MSDDAGMDDAPLISEDAQNILNQLDGVEKKINRLRRERDKLFDANDMLVELIQELEDELETLKQERSRSNTADPDTVDEQQDRIEVRDYHYSFGEGWTPKRDVPAEDRDPDLGEDIHPERLVLDADVDTDAINEQIHEVRKALKGLDLKDD